MQGLPVGLHSGTPEKVFVLLSLLAAARSGIIGGALEVYGPVCITLCAVGLRRGERGRAHPSNEGSPMKTIRLVSTPTRNRRLNEIIGMVVLVGATLLLLALASYTPTDPSFNTVGHYVTGRPAHNWTGMVGAYLADAMLQLIGVATFFLPLVLGRLGICWMRSRPAGSPLAKTIGLALWVVFGPAAIALLPGEMLWRGSLPIEGTTGRLLADFMVHYLNLPGAAIVLALMVAVSLYLATAFTFNTAREWAATHFSWVHRAIDRIR